MPSSTSLLVRIGAVLMLVLLTGCGSGKSNNKTTTATPIPTPTAQQTLAAASTRFASVNTAHYALTIAGNVYLDSAKTVALRDASGDLKRPGDATGDVNVSVAGATISVKIVAVGGAEYMTNFITGRWQTAPKDLTYNPAIIFDKNQGIQAVLAKIESPTMQGADTVNGIEAAHISGKVPRADVTPMTGNSFQGDPVDADLWVSRANNDLLKVVLKDTASQQGSTPATWTLLITKQNQPVTITKPST